MEINTCIWIYIYLRSSRATCGCGRWGLGGAVRCYVYMWSWSLNTLKYGYRPSGSWAGLKKQETRLIKKRGNQGPIQRVCMGAGGRGWDPFNLALRHRVPLPSSSPDPYELDPGEQCKRGGRVKREKGVKGGRGGGRIISLGNKWAFLSDNNWQARFHFPAPLQGPGPLPFFSFFFSMDFKQDKVIRKWNERTLLHRCVIPDVHPLTAFLPQHKDYSSGSAS